MPFVDIAVAFAMNDVLSTATPGGYDAFEVVFFFELLLWL
jgi:hypothetical protein